MFTLQGQTVKLMSFNPRRELHGETPEPAADLKIEATLVNDELAMFHPTLKSLLYHYDSQLAGDLVDVAKKDEDASYAPHLRFPKLGPLKYEADVVGATVSIAYGLKSAIIMQGCEINGFVLEPQNGGSVVVSFRVQGHPDEKSAGKLCTLIGCEIDLTIDAPDLGGDVSGK